MTITLRTAVLGTSRPWDHTFFGVFHDSNPTHILLTFDGANLIGYIDGRRYASTLRVNPGAAMVYLFKGVKSYNVRGYEVLYLIAVYAPLGVLLGLGTRRMDFRSPSYWILAAVAIGAPPILQEAAMSCACGCALQTARDILGCSMILGAFLLFFRRPRTGKSPLPA